MKYVLSICLFLSLCAHPLPAQITVGVAANMQFAMDEIVAAFKTDSGAEVKTVYNSSGKLTAQIKAGAPFDLFISADMGYPDSIYKWDLAKGPPVVYAYGTLVLWTCKKLDLSRGLGILTDTAVTKIALGDLTATVYGPASAAALKNIGVFNELRSKFVFGENIVQTGQYVALQAVDIGIVAKSLVYSSPMKNKGSWVEVPQNLYPPIAQGALILKYGLENHPLPSLSFDNYLFSTKSREILRRYGYNLPKEN